MLRIKQHLIIFLLISFLALFSGCNCQNHNRKNRHTAEKIEGESPYKSIQTTLNDIRKIRSQYWKKTKRTYYNLVSIIRDIQDTIDRAYEKSDKLNDIPLTATELILLESIIIETGKLEKIQEELKEEYEYWIDNLVEIFNISPEEVETYAQWIYKPNPDGNFLIHTWAYEEEYEEDCEVNSFILKETIDINCKNKAGLTALQIVTNAILAGDDDNRTTAIKKLELLLWLKSDIDINVIPRHDITLLLNLIRLEYPEKEKLIHLLIRHART